MISDPSREAALSRNRLQIAISIIESYDGSEPFHHFLSRFFAANKGFGSTDRRLYRSWCYSYFRLGKALPGLDQVSRMTVANFITVGNTGFPFQVTKHPELAEQNVPEIIDRIRVIESIYPEFSVKDIFQFTNRLSDGIDPDLFIKSLLQQPNVFIRVNRDNNQAVEKELSALKLPFRKLSEQTYVLAPAVPLQELKSFKNRLFQVQDVSSQKAGAKIPASDQQRWWDCCCGAGGKSLQLLDFHPGLRLFCSDKRESVIREFIKRLPLNAKSLPDTRVINAESNQIPFQENFFDGILADVPCSGSGTWGRTPEALYFFDEELLKSYTARQQSILRNVVPFLRPGGKLTYMTCSVFREENEDLVDWMVQQLNLKLIESSIVSGLENNSDSMFYAILEKP